MIVSTMAPVRLAAWMRARKMHDVQSWDAFLVSVERFEAGSCPLVSDLTFKRGRTLCDAELIGVVPSIILFSLFN